MNKPVRSPMPDTTEDVLLREDADGIAVLTLNRPHAANSLSEALLDALQAGLDDVGRDESVKSVIIAASGKLFCAGHDLKEMTARREDEDRGRAYFAWLMKKCATMMTSVVRCPKPVIAEVQGTASAAGTQLVASCDLAVASSSAQFCTPGVNIGLFCSTPMVAVSRNLARKDMMEMLLLGEMIPAERAQEFGLVNRVVAPEKLREASMAFAATIASKSPFTLAVGKEAFYRQLEMPLGEAYAYTSEVMVKNMLAHDAEEGINAFIEKREPTWQGR